MTLTEFRALTDGMPGDTNIAIWEDGDATWYEANADPTIPATPLHSRAVIVLSMGQQVEMEYDLAVRTGIDG